MTSRTPKAYLHALPSGRTKPTIQKVKVINFINLFSFIRKEIGTLDDTENFIGISHGVYWKMKCDQFLTDDSARKILEAYNKVKEAT